MTSPQDIQNMFFQLEHILQDPPPEFIFDNFDLFSDALKLYSQFEQSFRDQIWISLRQLYQRNLKELVDYLDHPNRSERQNVLDRLKMLSDLFFTCCELNEDKALAFANRPMEATAPGKRRAKKNQNCLISSAIYHRSKPNVLSLIVGTLSLKIEQLFEPISDVQTYVNSILKYVYVLITNTHKFKDDPTLFVSLCDVFVISIHRYDHSERFCQKVIELLQNSEELSASLASLVTRLIQNNSLDCNLLMNKLSKIQINDLSKDSSAPKAVSAFLIDVGKNCSKQMLDCLSTLELMLDQDSHMVRNAVFEIIFTVIIENFKNVDNYRDENIRDQLMDILEEYILDMNGYCRSKVLKFWTLLADAEMITRERYTTLTPKVADRLQDKSNFVRKSALAFLTRVCHILIPCRGLKDIFEAYHEVFDKFKVLIEEQRNRTRMAFKEIDSLMKGDQSLSKLREELMNQEDENDEEDEEEEEEDNDEDDDDEAEDDDDNENESMEIDGEDVDVNTKQKQKQKKKKKKSKKTLPENEFTEEEAKIYGENYNDLLDVKILVKKWHKISLELFVFTQTDDEFENGLEEIDEDELKYDSSVFGYNHFRRLLIVKNFKKAMQLLPALKRKYFNDKEFIINANNDVFLDNFAGRVNNCIKLARQIFLFPLLEMVEQNNPKTSHTQSVVDVNQVKNMLEKINKDQAEYEKHQQTYERFCEIIELIDQYDSFHNIITESLPKISDMLMSNIVNDVLEAIDFFVMAYNLKLDNSHLGVQQMLLLIRTKEKPVKDRLLLAFQQIYMNEKTEYVMEISEEYENDENQPRSQKEIDHTKFKSSSNKTSCFREIKNLLIMIKPLNQGELICAELLISEMYGKGMFSKTHLDILWSLYRGYIKCSDEDQRWAFIAIGMIACSNPNIILDKLQQICYSYTKQIPFKSSDSSEDITIPDYELAFRTSYVLLRIYPIPTIEGGGEFFKIDNDHQLFKVIHRILVRGYECSETSPEFRSVKLFYTNLVLKSVEVIYLYSKFPDKLIRNLMIHIDNFNRKFTSHDENMDRIISPTCQFNSQDIPYSQATTAASGSGRINSITIESYHIERFLYFLTAISKGFLLHMNYCVLRENQIRKRDKDMNKQKMMEERKKKALAKSAGKPTKEFRTDVMVNDYSSSDDEEANAEFGGSMGNDSTVSDYIQQQIFDNELFNNGGYLSQYYNFVKGITFDILGKRFPREVRIAAWHAICNFMISSKNITIKHREAFSECLTRCPDDEIRASLISYWGDILMRFPNQIEYLSPKIFHFLNEESRLLKSTALKTLSMIILADMLKPTGEIVQMAKLIVDEDNEIQSLTRLFFIQVANKDNQNIYNYLTDVISSHAGSESCLSEENFQEMVKFLFDLLEKSKSTESLVKKLAERFLVTKDTRLWRDLSFSLQLISYQEKSLQALLTKWPFFRATLTNQQVYENFQSLIQKLQTQFKESKNPGAVKLLEAVNDLEAKIKAVRSS